MKSLILLSLFFSLAGMGQDLKEDCSADLIKLCGQFRKEKAKRRECIKKNISKVSLKCQETLKSRRDKVKKNQIKKRT